jgi:hypothetical protein
MATKIDAPHASPLITLDFLSSLSRAKLELLMTATTLICSIFLFVFFFLRCLRAGLYKNLGSCEALASILFYFCAFSRDTTSTFVQSLDLGYRLGYTGIGLEHLEISLFFASPTV